MEFTVFHRYNRLVRRGLAKPLVDSCGNEFVLRVTEDNEPVLQCAFCNTYTQPGLAMYEDIRAVVKEFFA